MLDRNSLVHRRIAEIEPHGLLLGVALGAFAMRAANLAFLPAGIDVLMTPDSSIYLELRDNLLETGRFLRQDGAGGYAPEIERTPGYPLFLALLALLTGPSVWTIVWTQAVLDSLTTCLIAWLGLQVGPRTGIAAGALAACWPNMVVTSALVLNDTLFLLLFTAMLAACLQVARRPGVRWVAVAALLFGLSLMVRPLFQFVIPVIAAATAAAALRAGASRIKAAGLAALFLGLSLAPAAPLIARNVTLYDTPALTAQSGTHLLGWVVPLVDWQTEGVPFEVAFQAARADFEAHLSARGESIESLGSFATSQARSAFALERLSERPAADLAEAWIKGAILNLGAPALTADPRIRAARQGGLLAEGAAADEARSGWVARLAGWIETASPWATAAIVLGLAGSVAASLLQALGVFRLGQRAPWALAAGLALVAYVLLIMGPVAGPKYRLPAAPVFIVLTACGWLMLMDWIARRWPGGARREMPGGSGR